MPGRFRPAGEAQMNARCSVREPRPNATSKRRGQNQGSIYRDATKNRYVERCALLADADPGNICAGAEGHVGCKTFDQMAGELKA